MLAYKEQQTLKQTHTNHFPDGYTQNKTRHSHAPLSYCTHIFPFHTHLPCRQHKLDLQGLRGPETARTLLAESQTPVIVLGGRVCAKGFRRDYAERAHRRVPMPGRPHRLRLPQLRGTDSGHAGSPVRRGRCGGASPAQRVLPEVRGGRVQAGCGDAAAVQGVRGPQGGRRWGVRGEEGRGVWDGGERRAEQWEFVLHRELPEPVCVGTVRG